MGNKLTSAEIVSFIQGNVNQGFDTCSKCEGVELANIMSQVDPDSEDFDLICDECKAKLPKHRLVVTVTETYHRDFVSEEELMNVMMSISENTITPPQYGVDYTENKFELKGFDETVTTKKILIS